MDSPILDLLKKGMLALSAPALLVACEHQKEVWTERPYRKPIETGTLTIVGTVTSPGTVTLRSVRETPGAFIDRLKPVPGRMWVVECVDLKGEILVSFPWTVSFRNPGTLTPSTFSMFFVDIPFPYDAARVQFKRGDEVLHEFDPLSRTLRDAVERIADRGYEREPVDRRKALLDKVASFEEMLSKNKRRPAREKLLSDFRDKCEKWIVEYNADYRETSKAELLRLVDSIAARLQAQIGSDPAPNATP